MPQTNINTVTITGNLTQDPVLRKTGNGTPVTSIAVANNQRYKTPQGSWENKAHFIDVVAWGGLAENVAKFLEKGRGVAVVGRLVQEKYQDKQGGMRNSHRVVASDIQFLSGEGGSSNGDTQSQVAADDDIPF